MTTVIILTLTHAIAFAVGALVFRNNRNRIDRAEAKAREVADALRK